MPNRKLNRRRYYLNGKIRKVLTLDTKSKTISVTDDLVSNLSAINKKYLEELKQKFGYQAQYIIQ